MGRSQGRIFLQIHSLMGTEYKAMACSVSGQLRAAIQANVIGDGDRSKTSIAQRSNLHAAADFGSTDGNCSGWSLATCMIMGKVIWRAISKRQKKSTKSHRLQLTDNKST